MVAVLNNLPQPMDCSMVQESNSAAISSMYSNLRSTAGELFSSYCDMETMGGGWTLIMRRFDSSVSFAKSASLFEEPFGSPMTNFWLGNRRLRDLAAYSNYDLLIEMRTFTSYAFSYYNNFAVTGPGNQIVANLNGASTAGDGLPRGMYFIDDSCAGGPFWSPGNCSSPIGRSNFNGIYGEQTASSKNIYWYPFTNSTTPALVWVEMKMRRNAPSGRFMAASDFSCISGGLTATVTGIATAQDCKDACVAYQAWFCMVAVYNRTTGCNIQSSTDCIKTGLYDSNQDSYFRMDGPGQFTFSCGPPPVMRWATMSIMSSLLPGQMSLLYNCRPGFYNVQFSAQSTVLTCNSSTGFWDGAFLQCSTACGDAPDLSASNAVLTPNLIANVSTGQLIFTYACMPGYELQYGSLTRVCLFNAGVFLGSSLSCATKPCLTTELLSQMSIWGGSLSASSGTAANADGNGLMYWAPAASDLNPFLQIDFGKEMSVSILKVAGYESSWVVNYAITFKVKSVDSSQLFYPLLQNQSNYQSPLMVISGAADGNYNNFVPYAFCPNLRTQILRIHPQSYAGLSANLRVLVKGCPPHASCSSCCTAADGCLCICPVGYINNPATSGGPNPFDQCDAWNMPPIDCEDIAYRQPNATSGVYTIYPPGGVAISVYCEMSLLGGGWTVIQNRVDGTQSFYQPWNSYKIGFGSLAANFWLGNDNINMLTAKSYNSYQLAIYMASFDNQTAVAFYNVFNIDTEIMGYTLHIGNYSGNAGDALWAAGPLSGNGVPFSTYDNDTSLSGCASKYHGAWWYKNCSTSNLNGVYGNTSYSVGPVWSTWKGYTNPLKSTKMMIRRSLLPYAVPSLQMKYPNPVDCQDIALSNPTAGSGIYSVYPVGTNTSLQVYCEMAALGGGWTVIQRNSDNLLNFTKPWAVFTKGFGSLSGSHYLGNQWIYALTNSAVTNVKYQLAVVLEDASGDKRSSIYQTFSLGAQNYTLNVGNYNPNNDAEPGGDALASQNGRPFQTYDQALGQWCSSQRPGGWWFKVPNDTSINNTDCTGANLNGIRGSSNFEAGIIWQSWKSRNVSLNSSMMMIKPITIAKPVDCTDVLANNPSASSGLYWIYPPGTPAVQTLCDMTKSIGSYGKGWTVFQARSQNNIDFSTSWQDYKQGFSFIPLTSTNDFWLGNEYVSKITQSGAYSLYVTVKNSQDGLQYTAFYEDFRISNESDGYRLYVGNYKASLSTAGDALSMHNMQTFSTFDNGTNGGYITKSSGSGCEGGWWFPPAVFYGGCNMTSNLNNVINSSNPLKAVTWISVAPLGVSMMSTQMAFKRKVDTFPKDCGDILANNPRLTTGIYTIYPPTMSPTQVVCDMFTSIGSYGTGWTVIQRRQWNNANFSNTWAAYKAGIKPSPLTLTSDYWLGNDNLNALTTNGNYSVLASLTHPNGVVYYALYGSFQVGPESDGYRLEITGYDTTFSTAPEAFSEQSGWMFSTPDNGSLQSCAAGFSSGFWFTLHPSPNCAFDVSLNGIVNSSSWGLGVIWYPLVAFNVSLMAAQLAIKRIDNFPIDCADILLLNSNAATGIYTIYPPGKPAVSVYCDMTTSLGQYGTGWTVIQRRQWNNANFTASWAAYKAGIFSSPLTTTSDYWLDG